MAQFTFASVADVFGVGTSVGAYLPGPNTPDASSPVSGAAITTAVVASDGSLTFTGLADDTAYVAYDSGSGKRRRFRSQPSSVVASTSRRPLTFVPFGDSFCSRGITVVGSASNRFEPRDNWIPWMQARLKQRMSLTSNLGVSGETTAQHLARIGAVTALRPGWVIWATTGTNDITAGTDAPTILANITSGVASLTAAGANVVLTTIPPRAAPNALSAGQEAVRVAVNLGIKALAKSTAGVIVADTALAISQADGTPRTSALEDGLHTATTGAMLFGRAVADAISPFTAAVSDLVESSADLACKIANPLMTGTAGTKFAATITPTGNVATSWTARTTAAAGTVVGSKVVRTDGISGEWQQLALAGATAAQVLLYQDVASATLPAGTLVQVQAEIEIDAATVTNLTDIELQALDLGNSNSGAALSVNHGRSGDTAAFIDGLPTSMVLKTPVFTVPVGTTGTRARIITTADAITFRVGRVDLRIVG
jgi:lysophospholipase L1-like esterase